MKLAEMKLITKDRLQYYHQKLKKLFASKSEVAAVDQKADNIQSQVNSIETELGNFDGYENSQIKVTTRANTTKSYDVLIKKQTQGQGGSGS